MQAVDDTCKCRICLKSNDDLYHLLSEVNHDGETFAFKELMQRVTNLEIPLMDHTSKGICIGCMEDLVKAYSLVDSIREAEEYWRNARPVKLQSVDCSEQNDLEPVTKQQQSIELTNIWKELEYEDVEKIEWETTIKAKNESGAKETMEIDTVDDEEDDCLDVNVLIEVDYSILKQEVALTESEIEAPKVRFEQDEFELQTSCFMDCSYCGKRKKKENYEFHLMQYHYDVYKENIAVAKEEKRLYKCEHCNMEFSIGICYEDHLKVNHKSNENEFIYICPLCKRSFKKEQYFQLHFKCCASGQEPTTDSLPIIEKKANFASEEIFTIKNEENVADSKQDFNNDPIALEERSSDSESALPAIANNADSDSDYWAPYWSENEKESEALNTKIVKSAETTSVEDQDKLPCTHCSKMFRRKYDLRKHLREKHNISVTKQEGTFACSHCPREFPFLHRLEAHQRLLHKDIYAPNVDYHQIYPRSLCHYCGQMVMAIKQHIWRHEDYKPHKCQYCDASFVVKTTLEEHERVHTGEKPYKCEVCGKCFRKGPMKIIHMRIHEKEKSYKCKLCDKTFGLLSNLKSHINAQHTGERPHTCNVCDKSFTNNTRLHVHRKKHNHWDTSGADKFVNSRVGKNRYRWKL